MTSKETLDKLNKGCSVCKAKLCNLCPVGSRKKVLEKELGLTRLPFWKKAITLLQNKKTDN